MMMTLKLFGTAVLTLAILDGLWLGLIAKKFYQEAFAPFGGPQMNLFPAAITYLLLVLAVLIFALPRLTADDGPMTAFITGALLGLFIYGVYDFTNVSTLKDWGWAVTLADCAWGTVLIGCVTMATKFVRDM